MKRIKLSPRRDRAYFRNKANIAKSINYSINVPRGGIRL